MFKITQLQKGQQRLFLKIDTVDPFHNFECFDQNHRTTKYKHLFKTTKVHRADVFIKTERSIVCLLNPNEICDIRTNT
jgi:hypothetical protein